MEPSQISALLYGLPSLALFIVGICQFRQIGFHLHESYIFASKKEREESEFSTHYKHAGFICFLLGLLLLLNALQALFSFTWFHIASTILLVVILLFGIYSFIHITNQKRFK